MSVKSVMIIEGKETYRVAWEDYGWSYARPVIKARCKIPFIPFDKWRVVGYGYCENRTTAERMLPSVMRQWYSSSIKNYEQYNDAWAEEYSK